MDIVCPKCQGDVKKIDGEYFPETDDVIKNGECLNCNTKIEVTYTLEIQDVEILEK